MIKVPLLSTLNLGEKFKVWRQYQNYAVHQIVNEEKEFLVQVQPTGSGKSLCYVAAAHILPGRTLILTSFKGLQDQLQKDFGLYILMGRGSYKCRNPKSPGTCEDGVCRSGGFCPYSTENAKGYGCRYLQAIRDSNKSKIVVTNYAFWIANRHKRGKLGDFDLLVCDEAHIIHNYVLDHISVTIKPKDTKGIVDWPSPGKDFDYYIEWMKRFYKVVAHRVKDIKLLGKVAKNSSLIKLQHRLVNIPIINKSNWVIEHTGDRIKSGMIRPTDIIQKYVFNSIPRTLLTSATIDRHSCEQMGIVESNSTYTEFQSNFPVARRPIYSLNTVRVDHRMSLEDQRQWLRVIDKIISDRLGLRGIIHTISYDRCKYVMEHSEYREFMMTHTSKNLRKVVEEFKTCTEKFILVSPSVVTGWDFPYDECRYQVVGKIPFPNLRSTIDKARKEVDPEYGMLLALQNLIQICGRGMRHADDSCETFITDGHARWFLGQMSKYAPNWFKAAVAKVDSVPEPMNF